MRKISALPRFTASLVLCLSASLAGAADSGPEPVRPSDPLTTARQHVQARLWLAALTELRRVNATEHADWNNLMGFVLRRYSPPDLVGAQRHYDAALRINPRHLGALEYSGELALMRGDLATAEARLADLARLCKTPCEPLDDLGATLAGYKARGGKL